MKGLPHSRRSKRDLPQLRRASHSWSALRWLQGITLPETTKGAGTCDWQIAVLALSLCPQSMTCPRGGVRSFLDGSQCSLRSDASVGVFGQVALPGQKTLKPLQDPPARQLQRLQGQPC